jgi:tetratricopeptide (TPR) repeat protein
MTEAWASLILLALIPFHHLAAQDAASSFEEVAAQAAAARDVDDVPRSIELYTLALQLNPKWEEGWWFLGLQQYGSGAFASAIDAFSQLLTLNPESARALALRGLCEFETGDYPNRSRTYGRAFPKARSVTPKTSRSCVITKPCC